MAKGAKPLAIDVSFTRDALHVRLADGRKIRVPLAWFPRLHGATARQQKNWKLIGGGSGIHWPEIDGDLSVEELLATA